MELACLKRDLENERSMKVHSINESMNPVEKEFLERELILIDAQISWVEQALFEQTTAA